MQKALADSATQEGGKLKVSLACRLPFTIFATLSNITYFMGFFDLFKKNRIHSRRLRRNDLNRLLRKTTGRLRSKIRRSRKIPLPSRLPEPLTGSRRNSTPVWRRPKRASSRNWRGPLPVDRPSIHRCSTIWRRCSSPPT